MAKERKLSTPASQKSLQTKFDPESALFFALKAFGLLLIGMVILFGEFIFF